MFELLKPCAPSRVNLSKHLNGIGPLYIYIMTISCRYLHVGLIPFRYFLRFRLDEARSISQSRKHQQFKHAPTERIFK